ncbi:MAG: hypothetical protein ACK5JD_11050 [Mangrovibacterium sp.]
MINKDNLIAQEIINDDAKRALAAYGALKLGKTDLAYALLTGTVKIKNEEALSEGRHDRSG